MKEYDYIIVGAGLYGAVFAHLATAQGKRCLVLERRDHVGGNCHTRPARISSTHLTNGCGSS